MSKVIASDKSGQSRITSLWGWLNAFVRNFIKGAGGTIQGEQGNLITHEMGPANGVGKLQLDLNPVLENGSDLPLRGMRVLAVEDSLDNQLLIQRLLHKRGAEVDIAVNGEEGVEKALQNEYSIVLMDIQMPVLDGYGATAKLRSAGYTKPIVALTAHALEEDRRRCLGSGFDEHLTKPISSAALLQTILSFRS